LRADIMRTHDAKSTTDSEIQTPPHAPSPYIWMTK